MASIAANRFYNDPTLGKGFSNLAQIFAPPKGSDLAGYALADSRKQEAERLAQLFTYATDPSFDQTRFDRLGQAAGRWTPSTGYYGVDTTARTSRDNNTADNARALEQTRLTQTGETERTLLGPVSSGATRFVPPSIAQMYGLPEQQVGVIEAKPGERVVTPDGRTIEGAPKPPSETEWRAAQNERLRQSGQITDEMLVDGVMGERAPVQAVGPDSKPVFMSPGAAVRQGAQPAPTGQQGARKDAIAVINGQQVPVTRGPSDLAWQTADGTPIPPDARVLELPKATGTGEQVGLPTTANNTAANNQAAQVTQALNTLDIYENLIRNNPGTAGIVGLIRGTAQNAVASARDLAAQFGKQAPQIEQAAASIRQGLSSVAPELFDPAIPEANFLSGTLAYAIARTENPSGEVSRQAYERALERISGGALANSQSILANIGAYRKVLQAQQSGVGALRDPRAARTDTSFQQPGGAQGATTIQTPQGPVTIQRVP